MIYDRILSFFDQCFVILIVGLFYLAKKVNAAIFLQLQINIFQVQIYIYHNVA